MKFAAYPCVGNQILIFGVNEVELFLLLLLVLAFCRHHHDIGFSHVVLNIIFLAFID
jgi:hypothetical protein